MTPSPLHALIERADRLINAERFDALMDFYTEDALLVVKPGLTASGKAEIKRAFVAIAEHFKHSLVVRQHALRELVAGDTALVLAQARLEALDDSQPTLIERQATYVFRREADGRWRCAVDNSYGTALLETPPPGIADLAGGSGR
ncbi:SgcJ/EcaC family oxidoreductase [Pseudomonas sp. RIT-PI-AD]|uniref:YybH family protein n=1 Tax=Pseudomonas sp. RIT-PI-AD TaxID=3035294 RepID=UPI0021D98931|nr:SgcJ/EcaC family oxidoreductase [Pseudomonas sp. RIT-PI-AD]